MKTGKEFYQAGDAALEKGDLHSAVQNFKQAGDMDHQHSVGMLLSIYGSGQYNISPQEILGELKHFSDKENIYAMLYLGRIRLGDLQNAMNPLLSGNHAAFASAVSQNDYDSIALVDKAADKAKRIYEDQGHDTFDVLGIECTTFSDAYDRAERRLREKIKDAMNNPSTSNIALWLKVNYPSLRHYSELESVAAGFAQKSVRFIDMAIKWATKYLPQTKQLLDMFNVTALALRGKVNTYNV